MDLKEFVSETLRQVIEGVKEAQISAPGNGAVVAPYYDYRKTVEYDVAVTAVEGTEAGAKAGISVWSIGAGGNVKTESTNTTVSRIKFSIPLELPKGSHEPESTGVTTPSGFVV
ncbi:MAG: hypothetical protein DRP56_05000 [Planctomycetota bacterium]|nr:MAG: hypothetical protein DRP56_05000 [Planctomycetota bacterium]